MEAEEWPRGRLAPSPRRDAPSAQEAAAGRQAVLVPSRDRKGTNALYRSPPTLFPSRFGPDSLTLHEAEARRRGADVRVVSVEALELDIDDASDVAELFRRGVSCPPVVAIEAGGEAGAFNHPISGCLSCQSVRS